MLSDQQLDEIRGHLEAAQNPIFLFDNDVDGLCSFLVLQKAIGRGMGFPVKSFPDLNSDYLRKVDEFNSDYIFILDKAIISSDFIDGAIERNIPIVWIDHHDENVDEDLTSKVAYYNSVPSCEPTTYLAWNVFRRKQDIWLALIGCIGDVYMPDFGKEYARNFPEAFDFKLNAFDAMFLTDVGKVSQMLNFGLKDSTTHVVGMMKMLYSANGIYDVLEENSKTRQLHFRYKEIKDVYDRLIKRAEDEASSNSRLIFFSYSGNMSISSEVSNGIYFRNKDKLVVVCYKSITQDKVNISMRGIGARDVLLEAINGIEGGVGGGHAEACGGRVPLSSFEKFKSRIEEIIA